VKTSRLTHAQAEGTKSKGMCGMGQGQLSRLVFSADAHLITFHGLVSGFCHHMAWLPHSMRAL